MTSHQPDLSGAPGVIVVTPPWPKAGSSNTFAAEVAAHARAGRAVLLLMGPTDAWHASAMTSFWRDTVEAMRFPGLDGVAYARTLDPMTPFSSVSFFRWRLAGRDDAIAISARYAAHAKVPDEALTFIRGHPIEVVHVNHCFEMQLGLRLAALAESVHFRRPMVVLDTHDVQASNFHTTGKKNPFSGTIDPLEVLERTEQRLCDAADVLTHCSAKDLDYFSDRLPHKRHELLFPSLHPATERNLSQARGQAGEAEFDFLYVGNNNQPNFESVVWLLDRAMPLLGQDYRIAIVGKVGHMVRDQRPDLHARYQSMLVGEVDRIEDYYRRSRVVLAPAVAGTGTSMKLIEGLCAGKPVVTTSQTLRGLPPGSVSEEVLRPHDTPEAFVAAMRAQHLAMDFDGRASADCYDRLFSNQRFCDRVDEIVGRGVSKRRTSAQRINDTEFLNNDRRTAPHPHFGPIAGMNLNAWLQTLPQGAVPRISIVIASQERTGSEWLCQMMGQTGVLGRPSEYLNSPWMRRFIADYPDEVTAQVAVAHRAGTTENGCFSMKMHPWHFDRLSEGMPFQDVFPNAHFVRLDRRDRLAQAISLFRARQTKRYHAHLEEEAAVTFDAESIAAGLAEIARNAARWEVYFARNGIAPLSLYYEDLESDPVSCLQKIAQIIGETPKFQDDISRSWLRVQRDATTEDWKARFIAQNWNMSHLDVI